MVLIIFQNGSDWYKANWVFRQFAKDTISTFPNDAALKLIMEKAQAFGGLYFDSMGSDETAETLKSMKKVAEGIIERKIEGWIKTKPDDKEGQRMYLESVEELLQLISKQVGPT